MADDAELRITITDNSSGSSPRAGDRQNGYRDPQGRWRDSRTHRYATDPDSVRRTGSTPPQGRTGSTAASRNNIRREARDRGEGMAKALARALGRYIGGTAGRVAGGTGGRILGSAAGNVIGSRIKNAATRGATARLTGAGIAGAAGGAALGVGAIALGVATTAATLLQIQRYLQGRLTNELGKLNGSIASSLGATNADQMLARIDQANELADELSLFVEKESQISIAVRELQTSIVTLLSPFVNEFQNFIIWAVGFAKSAVDTIPKAADGITGFIESIQDTVGEWVPFYGKWAKDMRELAEQQAAKEERKREKERRKNREKYYNELEGLLEDTIADADIRPIDRPR